MRSLQWNNGVGNVVGGGQSITLAALPDALTGDRVEFTDGAGRCAVLTDGAPVWRDLTPAECQAADTCISVSLAALGGPTVEHAVDAAGNYLGLVPVGGGAMRVGGPPPAPDCIWQGGIWVRVETLEKAIARTLDEIDAAAGAARMKYITDVPGQQATYLLKQQQAEAFLYANPSATPGPYLVAEAEAMGVSPIDAAQEIVTIAGQWTETLGPAIEKARRAGKIAVGAAQTLADVATHRQAAFDALAAI